MNNSLCITSLSRTGTGDLSASSGMDLNFGPKQRTLLEEITHILREYPDGSNILKELLQNADDAEANSIAFLLDPTQHSQVNLVIPDLTKYQGPALYSWNDAVFGENDWKGIQRIGKSIKEKTALKVGRFGLGFVSVYHLTDCPTILSDKQFGINHPLKELTSQGQTGVSCSLLSLTTNPQLSGHLSCFKGYFGFEGQSEYPGTIFRFPFRNVKSDISEHCYDVISVRNKLLNPLISEAEYALLFLKNLTSIEVCERVGEVDKALFKAEVPSANLDNVKSYRREILEFASSEEFKSKTKIFVCLFPTMSREFGSEEKHTVWLVVNILGFGVAKGKLHKFYHDYHLDYLPWVGVALATGVSDLTNCGRWQFEWNDEIPSTVFDCISEVFKCPFIVDQDIELDISTGKIFCFLPTQLHSKFPFHFHGYFSLSSNRRAIPWPSHDNESDIGARWNLLLSEDLGSIAYAVFLFITIKALKHPSPLTYHYQFLSHWSPHEPDNSPFNYVLCGGLQTLSKHNILLYTQQQGGSWLPICDGFFLPNLTKQYLLHEKVCLNLLEKLNEPIIDIPESIQEVILNIPGIKSQISDRTITQNTIRELLTRFSGSNDLREFLSSRDNSIPLLEVILAICSGIESPNLIKNILEGIPLLPIAGCDEPQIFTHNTVHYISSNTSTLLSIFPGLESLFVDPSIPLKIHSNLLSIARKCTSLNLIDVTNLANNPQLFAELLFQSLSCKFTFEPNESVDWKPSYSLHPSSIWIVKLFQFIDNSQSLLDAVSHLPILPQNSIDDCIVRLLPLKSHTGTTYIEYSNDVQLMHLEKLLETPGCYFCNRQQFIVRFNEFVLPPIPKGLFLALKSEAVLKSFIKALESTGANDLKFDLIELLIPITNAQNSKIVYQLPLFPNTIGHWIKLTPNVILPPLNIPSDIAYPPHFISPFHSSVTQLYKKLNSISLSNNLFIKSHLMPFILSHEDPCIRNQLMLFVMDNLRLFDLDYLMRKEWILDGSTNNKVKGLVELYAPSQLLDPRDRILNKLLPLQTCGLFPNNLFEDYFEVMRKYLSLKSYNNLSSKLCIKVCRCSLENIISNSGNDWLHTFAALIDLLRVYRRRFDYIFWKTLLEIFKRNFVISESIPVDWPKNVNFSTSTRLCSPQQILICNSQDLYLVGSVQNTLILSHMVEDDVSKVIIHEMGFITEITCQMVVEHLVMLTKSRITKDDSVLIHKVVSNIYLFLDRRVEQIRSIQLNDLNLVYIPGQVAFVSQNRIVMEVPFDLKPYIYSLTDLQYRADKFFQFLKIQTSPNSLQLSSILTEMYSTCTILTSAQLELVINILNMIVNLNSQVEVYIPGKDMRLYSPKEDKLVFCDQIWLNHSIIEQDFIFVHEKISNDTAHRLGVSHFNERITVPSEMWFEETGQKIAVTDRIRGILEGYHGTINVLKEMLQNADDAKATEMNVVFDWRIHPNKSLLSPQMEVWQGPAILFYNNSTFLDADFDNLMKIEAATKAHDVTSIGQFGLGFCTVYHLTDLPSFVSRNYIHILDPHGEYLKRGMKIDFCQEKLAKYVRLYQDQFAPYQGIFGCDVLKPSSFNGTLFRLPIRLGNITSKISLATFNEQNINQIQDNFVKEAESVLFFMQHIHSLGIYVINSDSSSQEMERIHYVSRTANIPSVQPFLQTNREIMIRVLNGCYSSPVSSSCEYQLSVTNKSNTNWIVTFATGSEPCANLLNKFSHTISPLPFAGVAFNLDIFYQDRTTGYNSNLYCFLPLPIKIALPFHCHAMFELRQDRQGLVDTAQAKTEWNKVIISDALVRAAFTLYKELADRIRSINTMETRQRYTFLLLNMFSKDLTSDCLWNGFTRGITNEIINSQFNFFIVKSNKGIEWCSFKTTFFLNLPSIQSDLRGYYSQSFSDSMFHVLIKCGYQIAVIPEISYQESGMLFYIFGDRRSNVVDLRKFSNIFFENLNKFEISGIIEVLNVLIPACCSFSWFRKIISSSKCIPCGEFGELQCTYNVVDPNATLVTNLYEAKENKNPTKLCRESLFQIDSQTLHNLITHCSVISFKLSVEELKSRANYICKNKNEQLAHRFIEYLDQKIFTITELDEMLSALSTLTFIPVIIPILSANSISNQLHFKSPCQLIPCKLRELVEFQLPVFPEQFQQYYNFTSNIRISESEFPRPLPLIAINELKICINNYYTLAVNIDLHAKVKKIYETLGKNFIQYRSKIQQLPNNIVLIPSVGFCDPSILFQSSKEDFSPFIHSINSHYDTSNRNIGDFFYHLGVRKSLSVDQCHKALIKLYTKSQDTPLDVDEQRIVLRFTNEICNNLTGHGDKNFILCLDNRVHYVEDCIFHDLSWDKREYSNGVLIHKDKTYYFIHKDVSNEIAFRLGVNPLSSIKLSGRKALPFRYKSHGQSEPLTTRLKNIISEYECDVDVFKELTQNADDAKASVVKFLFDHSVHGIESLLHEEMKHWQGPAVYCYNDATFSDTDFENITKLASRSKMSDQSTIGAFGTGFNTVYHLTDLPSFVSRCNIIFFDPHVSYLKKLIDHDSPGMQIDFVNENCEIQDFKDQFSVYNGIFGCDLFSKNEYNHTLFRLPLRTSNVSSKISQRNFDSKKSILTLQTQFLEIAKNLILFLQNIQCIEIYTRSDRGNNVSLVYRVKKSLPNRFLSENLTHFQILLSMNAQDAVTEVSRFTVTTLYPPNKETDPEEIIVSYASGTTSSFDLIPELKEICEFSSLPVCAVAVFKSFTTLSLKEFSKVKCSLFSFLPIPCASPYPMHINGCFQLQQSRRAVYSTADSTIRTRWNQALICDPLPIAVVNMLISLKGEFSLNSLTPAQIERYYCFWPNSNKDGVLWSKFSSSIATRIISVNAPIFYCSLNPNRWITLKDVSFFVPPTQYNLESWFINEIIFPYSARCGIYFMDMFPGFSEHNIFQEFPKSKTYTVERFYKEIIPGVFENFETDIIEHNTIIYRIISILLLTYKYEPCLKELLTNLKCIPCGEDDPVFLAIPQVLSPNSIFRQIFYPRDKRLPHSLFHALFDEIESSETFHTLNLVGVITDKLPLGLLVDRCSTTLYLSQLNKEQALRHSECLLDYLNSLRIDKPQSDKIKNMLFDIQFIPVYQDAIFNIVCPETKCIFSSPSKCRDMDLLYLSVEYHIITKEVNSRCHAVSLLGISGKDIPLNSVMETLFILEQNEYLLSTQCITEFDVTKQCRAIYNYLAKKCFMLNESSEQNRLIIQQVLEGRKWIWVNSLKKFYPISQVISSTDYLSYKSSFLVCFTLPEMIDQESFIGKFFKFMKLPTNVTSSMAIKIISLIKEHFENSSLPSPTPPDCGPNELGLVIKLINEVIEVKGDENFESIYLVTENNNLKLSSSLYRNDVPWLEFPEEEKESLVNHRITTKVSHKLGAKSKMNTLYAQEWEEFGQHEDMSKRIDNLLREFPLDVTIFKELIQNADDAEATEVVFILDSQEYGHTSLCPSDYKPKWRELQKTPSLLVYNNKSFSPDDLSGIQAVGIGGKEGKNTIGRFGLGFNSVFHLTRCPCLLTYSENGEESVFCVFDPHKEHLKIPKGMRPGTKVTFNSQRPLSCFTHQFEPYFAKPIINKYPDAMENLRERKSFSIFRLPLNTTIDKRLDTQENVKIMRELLHQLKREAPRLLPFISNVKKIQIYEISSISSCTPPIVSVLRNVEITSQLLNRRRVEVEKPIAGYSRTMQILQKTVSVEVANLPTDTLMLSNKVEWLIYHFEGNVDMFLGRSELLQKFKPKYEIEKLRLFSSIAVEITSNDNPVPTQKRYLYCHLPFGTSLNFPVHINAPFILDPHRRYVSYQDEISGSNSWDNVWHHEIMKLVLAPIYFKLLYDLGPGAVNRCCGLTDIDYFDWYYSLFPVIHKTESGSNSMEYLQALGKSVLTLLYQSNSEVLLADDISKNVDRTWYPIHGPDAGVFKILEPELTESIQVLYNCLIELKYHLTLAPNTLANSFMVCNEGASECKVVTPLDVSQYIYVNKSNLCKNNLEFPCSLQNCTFNFYQLVIILQFILTHFGKDPKAKEKIPSIPLMVDYANNLGLFQLSKSTFTMQYANLLPQNSDRFISKEYNLHNIKELIEFGYVEALSIQFLSQNMENSHQPSPEYFLLFWQFIYENVRDPEKLSQFGRFNLVPVTYGRDHPTEPTFQPINHLEHLATDEIESTLRKILFKFKCPFLYLTPYLAYNTHPPEGMIEVSPILHFLESLAIRTIDGNTILGCVSFAKNIEVELTVMEAEKLRNLFPNINYKNLSGNDWKTLSRIKMFVAEYKPGEYCLVALKEYMVCYMNNDNFPISENLITKLRDVFKIFFLSSDITHHNPLNLITNICKRVGISCLALNEFMESYILNIEVLPRLEFEIQKAIIIYIFEHSGKKDNWISRLKSLPFIRVPESMQLYFTPNELYCPNIPLFAAFKKDKLLPQCWAKVNDLYAKIVTLGLKTKISLNDILDCANYVAINDPDFLEYDYLKLPIRALIKFVDSYIYMEESEEVELIFQQISTLKFLPIFIRQTFIGTVENPGIRWRLGMFSEAIISKHRDYCCLSSPIFDPVVSFKDPVSDPSKNCFNRIMNSLGFNLIPSIHLVKLHLQNLIELFNTYSHEEIDQHLKKLFFATYNYLQNSPDALPEFENEDCILFESKLYQPLNIVMNWRNDLSPYLFQCPQELKQFRNFLLKLKVSEFPNYEHFKFVLSCIHQENGSNQLNPENNILCAKSENAFSFLISELHSLPTDMQIARDCILLLTDKNQFIPYDSPHLYYGDDTQLLNRVESAHNELRILAPLAPNKFGSFAPPHSLGIKFLSDRFKQRLSPGVYEKYKAENTNADNLKERLKSVEVLAGLKRIYFHDTHKNMSKVRIQNKKIYLQTEEDQYRIADGYLSISDKIDKLDIVPVSRIDIVILDTSTEISRTLDNACICFLDEDKDTILINTDKLYRERLPVEMTYELNQYFANVFDRSLIHLLICHVYPGADIGRALNNFKITQLPHDLAHH